MMALFDASVLLSQAGGAVVVDGARPVIVVARPRVGPCHHHLARPAIDGFASTENATRHYVESPRLQRDAFFRPPAMRTYYTIRRNASIELHGVPYTLHARMLVWHSGAYSSAWPLAHMMVKCEDPTFGLTEFAVAEHVLTLVTACDGCSRPLTSVDVICRKCNAQVYCTEQCLRAASATHTATADCTPPIAKLVGSACVDRIVQFAGQLPPRTAPDFTTTLQMSPLVTSALADCATRAPAAQATRATPPVPAAPAPTPTPQTLRQRPYELAPASRRPA